jgi:hypothetical protein
MLDNLYIPINVENQTPKIDFKSTGELVIEGQSFPEDPLVFYEPVINWVKKLCENPPKEITFTLRLEYFNTSTSKLVLHMFKKLEDARYAKFTDVNIVWYYNKFDEDMFESGKDYESIIDLPFKLIEYE